MERRKYHSRDIKVKYRGVLDIFLCGFFVDELDKNCDNENKQDEE